MIKNTHTHSPRRAAWSHASPVRKRTSRTRKTAAKSQEHSVLLPHAKTNANRHTTKRRHPLRRQRLPTSRNAQQNNTKKTVAALPNMGRIIIYIRPLFTRRLHLRAPHKTLAAGTYPTTAQTHTLTPPCEYECYTYTFYSHAASRRLATSIKLNRPPKRAR